MAAGLIVDGPSAAELVACDPPTEAQTSPPGSPAPDVSGSSPDESPSTPMMESDPMVGSPSIPLTNEETSTACPVSAASPSSQSGAPSSPVISDARKKRKGTLPSSAPTPISPMVVSCRNDLFPYLIGPFEPTCPALQALPNLAS